MSIRRNFEFRVIDNSETCVQKLHDWFYARDSDYAIKDQMDIKKKIEENNFETFEMKYIHNAVRSDYTVSGDPGECLPKGVTMATAATVNSRFQDSVNNVKEQVSEYLNAKQNAKLGLVIADALYGLGKESWDTPDQMWKSKEFEEVIEFLNVS